LVAALISVTLAFTGMNNFTTFTMELLAHEKNDSEMLFSALGIPSPSLSRGGHRN